jgi:putative hemolysin
MTEEEIHKKNFKPIVLNDLFMDKSPGTARWIPGFIYQLIGRIMRLDFINNNMLYEHGYKKDAAFAEATLGVLNVTVETIGKENFPSEGRQIFVSNHPLGGYDGMMIITELNKYYPSLKVLVNDIITNVKNMDAMFVPINKHGAQAMENVRRINAIFESDAQVMSFPAGLVSRRKKGVIRDPDWQKSIITKARSSKRDIVPMHVTGRNSNFFYNLSNLRKFFGIKTNLEMFFLPNESYNHKNEHFIITVGEPIPYETFDNRFSQQEWALIVQDHVYQMAGDPGKKFEYTQNKTS